MENFSKSAFTCWLCNYDNIKTVCEICVKLIIKTLEWHHWRGSGVLTVTFDHIWHIVLVFPLLLWTSKYQLGGCFRDNLCDITNSHVKISLDLTFYYKRTKADGFQTQCHVKMPEIHKWIKLALTYISLYNIYNLFIFIYIISYLQFLFTIFYKHIKTIFIVFSFL